VPTLQVGNTQVHYAVRFSDKAKRNRLAVRPDGQVEAVAPRGANPESVEAFVAGKRSWLIQKLEAVQARRSLAQQQRYESGAKLLYRGRWLLLKVERTNVKQVEIECRSRFYVKAPKRWSAERRQAEIAVAFDQWLRDRCEADVKRLARRYASALNVDLKGARIGNQKGMWGSCGRDGVVRINWRLIQAPFAALEYVVAHEVCHLRHRSHDPKFWQALGAVMPDWPERKALLESWEAENRIHGAL
jgi:predicted metal-dependent hydrolase